MLNKELSKYMFLTPRNKRAEKYLLATRSHTYSSYLFKKGNPLRIDHVSALLPHLLQI